MTIVPELLMIMLISVVLCYAFVVLMDSFLIRCLDVMTDVPEFSIIMFFCRRKLRT